MKKLNSKQSIVWKEMAWVLIMVIVCYIILFTNRTYPFFITDEGDNFLGAKMVANGLDVYKEFTSQHMPLMYYICSVFYLLGARTVIQFRLFFYAFLCLVWACMYLRYNKFFGKLTMSIYPLLYMCAMHFVEMGYSVLSEQMWAQGMVILLLEYLIYVKQKRISVSSSCWISFAVFISFGTAFMSAASIGIVFLAVLISEIIIQSKEKEGFIKGFQGICKRNGRMILIILFPFIILVLWYLISGNLYNAYYGSFVVNREYYPKYNGSIQTTLGTLWQSFIALKNWIWCTNETEVYLQLIIFGVFLVFMFLKRQYLAVVCVFLFTVFCGIRGIDTFHALPMHAVFMMMGALLFGEVFKAYIRPRMEESVLKDKIILVGCCIAVLAAVYFPIYRIYYENKQLLRVQENESVDAYPEGYDVIKKLTYENEEVYECTMNPWFFFATDTLPSATSAACPWIYDAYKNEILKDLQTEPPRIVVYDEDISVWGYRFGDFAADMCEYFEENYTLLDGFTTIHVRNDYYEEACRIVGVNQAN